MRTRHTRWLALIGTATLLAGTQPVLAAGAPAAAPDGWLPARAARQIEALAAAKASRTPTEQKVDSTLLAAAVQSSGRHLPAGVRLRAPVPTDRWGRARVEIRGRITPVVRQRVTALGGVVDHGSAADGVLRADVPLDGLTRVAALPQVDRVVSAAFPAITASMTDPRTRITPPATGQGPDEGKDDGKEGGKEGASAERRRRVAAALAAARGSRAPGHGTPRTGSVVSEGDRTHGVDVARAQRHVSGVGVTVGVLSDGVDSLPASVASGDLPPDVDVLPAAAGEGDEGTAMLEIVHDLAPRAHLAFATAFESEQGFADNIRALRAAGADIIVDDVVYFDESPFQDGPVARAVAAVSRDGAVYVSSAGNEGNLDDGTSGNYEGDFRASGRTIGKFAGEAHDFDPGPGVQVSDPATAASTGAPAILQWADPYGGAANDYDLYAVDRAGNVAAFSNDVQDGDDDAFERVDLPDTGGPVRLVVTRYSGADRYFQLTVFRGRFGDDGAVKAYATPSVTRGHSTVPEALSAAAVPADTPLPFDLEDGDPPNPSGPFPGRFGGDQRSERFTSDGPRRIFFTPTGTPLTPGNFGSTGGRVRRKPTLSAADGVSTSVPDFSPFFGTSASAPHAAAVAALALSGHPGLRPAALRAALARTAIDIERRGPDRDTGAGIIDAPALLAAVGATPQPYATAGDPVVTRSADGDAFVEPGETGTVAVPVSSAGDVRAAGVTVTLRSPTAGVTVTPDRRAYGDIPVGQRRQRTFEVTVPAGTPLGAQVPLRATVRFRGALSPQSSKSTLVVGEPAASTVTSTYDGPPVSIPDASDAGRSVSLPVTGVGPVSDVTFSIDGTSCSTSPGSTTVGLDHTFVGDLVGTLSAPDGTTVTLFDRTGGTGVNLCRTELSDAANRSIQLAVDTDAPFTGSWRPAEPLAQLAGRSGDGTWRFTAADTAPADTGSIRAVSVHVRGFAPPPG